MRCGTQVQVRPNRTGMCRTCEAKTRRCAACGRVTRRGGEHTCASVDLKGPRSCSDCGKLLSSVGYERWKTRCPQCEKKRWRKKERLERALLRRAFGNKCRRCGYEKCKDALHFHHKDASEKHLWSRHGEASVREIKAHPERFELLCANCHIELHVNLRRRHHQAV